MLREWLKTSTTFQRKQKPKSDLKVRSTEKHRTNLKNIVQKKASQDALFSLVVFSKNADSLLLKSKDNRSRRARICTKVENRN